MSAPYRRILRCPDTRGSKKFENDTCRLRHIRKHHPELAPRPASNVIRYRDLPNKPAQAQRSIKAVRPRGFNANKGPVKYRPENEIASTMVAVALAMQLGSDSESEEMEEDYDDLLSTLALAFHTISDSRYLNRGTRGSAGRLPSEAIAQYLSYPDRSFWLISAGTERAFGLL